jgi:nucleoside-diphosphate-sugar epimerase
MRPDPSEVMILQSDPSLAAEKLGWHPQVELEEGLQQTVDWMRNNLEKYRPDFLYA